MKDTKTVEPRAAGEASPLVSLAKMLNAFYTSKAIPEDQIAELNRVAATLRAGADPAEHARTEAPKKGK